MNTKEENQEQKQTAEAASAGEPSSATAKTEMMQADEPVYDLFGITDSDSSENDDGEFVFLDDVPEADGVSEDGGTEGRGADLDSPGDISRFTQDQLHDIAVFSNALDGLFRLVKDADYQIQVEFFKKNISVLRTIAHNSTGLLAYDEREPDDLLYASALVMRLSCGIPLIEELVDCYGSLNVWDYVPEQ